MSQIYSPSAPSSVEPGAKSERPSTPKATPQTRRDFDAALRRASQDDDDSEDALLPEPSDPFGQMRPPPNPTPLDALGAFVPTQPGAIAVQTTSASQALGGSAMTALPSIQRSTPPDAVPLTAGALAVNAAAGQPWQLNVPGNDPALAVRLVSTGTGHWQVRLAADGPTRLQLASSIDRLRDKLRQRSGDRIDDLSFDDDLDPESDAA